jgi:hypothetical protein
MIQFTCHCGHNFEVDDDFAGGVMQCPECKLLIDVPMLSELENIDPEGTYKLDGDEPPMEHPGRVQELTTVYTRDRFDANGAPIDLRGTTANFGPVPVEALAIGESAAPKYDPVTGELVEEIGIKPDPRPAAASVPIAKRAATAPKAVVNGMDVPEATEALTIPLRLFAPVNLLVMSIILLAHFFGQAMAVAMSIGSLILMPFWAVWHWMFLAHYGNVIDETGPASRPELPTPLRHLDWTDDTFGPAFRVTLALGVCYGPGAFLAIYARAVPAPVLLTLIGALITIGTFMFPAVVLTTTTSGTILNLRPDRVVATAFQCGVEYFLDVILFSVGGALWLAAVIGVNILGLSVLNESIRPPSYVRWYTVWGALLVSTYLLHFLCWHLGTLYRRHHEAFPWAYQRYHGDKRTPPGAFPVTRPQRPLRGRATPVQPVRVQPPR